MLNMRNITYLVTVLAVSGLMILAACSGATDPVSRALTATVISAQVGADNNWSQVQAAQMTNDRAVQNEGTATAVAEALATQVRDDALMVTKFALYTAVAQNNADATSTAVHEKGMTQTAEPLMTQTALDLKAQETALENKRAFGTAFTILIVVFGCVGILLLYRYADAHLVGKRKKESVVIGANGNPLIFADAGQTIVEPGKHVGPIVRIDQDGVVHYTQLSDDANLLEAFKSFLMLQMIQAKNPPETLAKSLQIPGLKYGETHAPAALGHVDTGTMPPGIVSPPSDPVIPSQLPASAPWEILNDWKSDGLCLGVDQSGPIALDFEQCPHLLIAGTSGAGKTRYGLRPLITGALAAGHQVAILDRSGLDFIPFKSHQNASLVTLSNVAECIGYLKRTNTELQQRLVALREAGASTWGMLGRKRLIVVIDEFSNLTDSAENSKEREELWRQARMIAAEGRKAGIHLVIALQNPNHKSLDLRIRRNTSQISFRVQDKAASNLVLGASGAEALGERQFILVAGNRLRTGVGFSPSDDDIARTLRVRTVEALPAPQWLLTDTTTTASDSPVPGYDLDEIAALIRQMDSNGDSSRKIEMEIFGYAGGNAHAFVKKVLNK